MNKFHSTGLLAFTVTIFGAQMAESAPVCLELFSRIGSYSPHLVESQSSQKGDRQQGYVLLMGLQNGSRSVILGGIEYTVSQNTLKIDRVVDNPEFHGNKIYRSVMERAIQKNPNIKQILITLDQRFVSSIEIDRVSSGGATALMNNAVVKELASLGFGKIKDLQVFPVNQRHIVSLIFERE